MCAFSSAPSNAGSATKPSSRRSAAPTAGDWLWIAVNAGEPLDRRAGFATSRMQANPLGALRVTLGAGMSC
jgi:hypothetical protein